MTVAVIFEFTPVEGRFPDYMKLVDSLREDLAKAERDYTMVERAEAPRDSVEIHG